MRGNKTPARIVTNFCTGVGVHDVITSANFYDSRLWGLRVVRGQILDFSIDLHRRPYNTLALPCECVITRRWISQKRHEREHSYYGRDMLLIQLCHRQWSWRSLQPFFYEKKCSLFSGLWLSLGDLTKDDIADLKHTAHVMYKVNYNGRTSYDINYIYCRIPPEGVIYDVGCDLLAMAKFLVMFLWRVMWTVVRVDSRPFRPARFELTLC